ncbi:LamG-like jellyroll fold domain-containing protein [Haloferula sargassicola]|uniref:FecR protein n=1 Tax=Haloferula sargassicola TaxID=490096 RepID=A0ABP9UNJ2_9BACT
MIDEARLEALLSAYFDLRLTDEEREELEAMLLHSSRARRIFHEHAGHHGALREWALRENGSSPVVEMPVRRPRTAGYAWIAAGLAACLALVLWLNPREVAAPAQAETKPSPEAPTTSQPADDVALLAEQIGVEWTAGAPGFATGSALPTGLFSIEKGLVRLDFYSGAKVYLEGPASLELVSPDLARLTSGKLTAQVPPPAHGFTVLSEAMKVVDRGTEFGMSVGNGGDLQVHVFDGEVDLYPKDDEGSARALYEGGAVAVHQGATTDLQADRAAFARPGELSKAAEQARDRVWRKWLAASSRLRQSRDLQVYYDFRNIKSGVLPNRAAHPPAGSEGILIGCEPVPGPWPQADALGFARTSDRVRFRLDGLAPAVTMLARVRVDSLPHDHNALLSMAPKQVGEIHWKLDRDGRLLLGMRASEEPWERLVSPPVVGEKDLGHWLTLATVIDNEAAVMRAYVDGREVATAPITRPTPVALGKANLGNFEAAEAGIPGSSVVRNFNGRFAEFAFFTRALTAEEIRAYP